MKALFWDVDGTLAETERDGHRVAFNLAFEAEGLAWRWDERRYGELLRITGGRERLMHDMTVQPDAPSLAHERDRLARAVHARKNVLYAELVRSGAIALREGVLGLMTECRERGIRLGITTTTSRSNVDALLRQHLGDAWAHWFAVLLCGEDVERKKPDPEVYLRALNALRIGALDAVAIEDSPGGVAAARAANIAVLVTRSAYFADAPIEDAIAIGPGLHDRSGWTPAPREAARSPGAIGVDDIRDWLAQRESVSQFSLL